MQDLRKALDDKDLDAVSIAAPNHWHTLLAIWACQAGKDVYVEKPCSHTVLEGRKLVEAARKYDRIVQHGTQSRSDPSWIAEVAAVRSGKYGKLLVAYGYASKPRRSIGFKPAKQPPKELDFDIWLGPAPEQPYHENIVHYNWHWFWDFGNGEIGNQGVHQMDIARWAMPDGAAPKAVVSLGGRFGYKDQGQTPNTQLTIIDFGGPKLFFEDRGLVDSRTTKVANEFYTDQGVIKNGKFFARGKKDGEPLPSVAAEDDRATRLAEREGGEAGVGHCPARPHAPTFRQLHRLRPQPQTRRPPRRNPRGAPLRHALPLGQHLLPARRGSPLRRSDRGLRRRHGGLRGLGKHEATSRRCRRHDRWTAPRTAWAAGSLSTPRPSGSSATTKRTGCSRGPTAPRTWCRTACERARCVAMLLRAYGPVTCAMFRLFSLFTLRFPSSHI